MLITFVIFILYNGWFANWQITSVTSSLFSTFLDLSCNSFFSSHSPYKIYSLSSFFISCFGFLVLLFVSGMFSKFWIKKKSSKHITQKVGIGLWSKCYLKSYLQLSGDIFINKTSMIQSFCLHHFLAHGTWLFLFRCHFYSALRSKLFESLENTDPIFLNLNKKDQVNFLLYSDQINKPKSFNQSIFNNVISYVKATVWFDKPLVSFKQWIERLVTSQCRN